MQEKVIARQQAQGKGLTGLVTPPFKLSRHRHLIL
jgi:hypothetical protein